MEAMVLTFKYSRSFSLVALQCVIVGLLFALFYGPVIPGLVKDWQEHSTFSYGILVPIITGYLVWQRRAELKLLPVMPSIWAGLPLLLAVTIGLIGQAIGDTFSVRVSMIFALGSVIWLVLGKEFLKAVLFPIFYLMLMIPVPYVFIKDLTYYLRYSHARYAGQALQLLGIPVYRETYFLHLPNMTLEVADICSGVSSVFALFAAGAVYAYYLPVRASLKGLLVAFTFPFAIVANLFRIVVTAILAFYLGPVVFQSSFHLFSGTLTFLLALSMLIFFGEMLRNKSSREVIDKERLRYFHGTMRKIRPGVAWGPYLGGIAILIGGLYASTVLGGSPKVTLSPDLDVLFRSSGPFIIAQIDWADRYKDSNAEIALSRVYVGVDQTPIELFVGYRGNQKGGGRLSSPKLILPGKWNFSWVKPARVDVGNATSIQANWMLTRYGNAARLVLYWYQFGGRTVAGEFDYRFEQAKRSIFYGRSDGWVVRLATPLEENEPLERAQERLKMFCKSLCPQLFKLPSAQTEVRQ